MPESKVFPGAYGTFTNEHILGFFSAGYLVQRRLSHIDVPANQLRHVPKKNVSNNVANMASIHVGVRHDDQFAIPAFFQIEIFANPATQAG